MGIDKILVVDDEEYILELISYNLNSSGFKVISATNGLDAMEIVKKEKPNLVLLDLMIPGMDGLEICKAIRNSSSDISKISIIMLTAKGEEVDKIVGLELGADDYMTKPFSVRELIARVKAVLRRNNSISENRDINSYENLYINFEKREVKLFDNKIDLTLKEFELLEVLVRNKGKILTREALLDKIWGYEYIGETRTVDVHIRYLRKKIEVDDKNPRFIETIRGVGYRFNPDI